jgi:hypothetical protein
LYWDSSKNTSNKQYGQANTSSRELGNVLAGRKET